jgi:hypothetical protein
MKKYFFLFFMIVTWGIQSKAIVLKNGKVERGEILTQNIDNVTLKKEDGSIITINRSTILKVSFREISDEEAKEIMKKEEKKAEPQGPAKLDSEFISEEHEQNKQIFALTEEVISLSRELEKQKEKIAELDKKIQPPPPPKYYQWDIVKKSAMFPGYGQFKFGEVVWGSFYSTLFVGGIVAYHQAWNAHIQAKRAYEDNLPELGIMLGTPSSQSLLLLFAGPTMKDREQVIETAKQSNEILNGIVGIYFVNLIDALIKRPNPNEQSKDSKSVSYDYTISPEWNPYHRNAMGVNYSLQATVRF